eukprot:TRINITY_DN19167_c0_g1_i1.p1 TRINITY_DN19167_c0_g1~~TRINITY_DN19167_c0_g1_i1.p1  ORF type:complete len:1535 (+),score=670.97 TRINITY_DN19167_c0_g1_i1:168-4772(+)
MARLLDKQWEVIQKKTFTKWVNSHLMKRGLTAEEITADFKDGLKLIAFFEILSNKKLSAKIEKNPRMKIQMIQNLGAALAFLHDVCGVKLIGISAEEIHDGNLKLILGMIWTIICKFQIDDISEEELSARDALLLWCRRKTEGYRDCKVDNFHTSWQDGMAFCAIIHKHRPDLIDYDSLDKNNARQNLQLAFDVASKELGIPSLLDVEDLVDIAKPDERSIITYVSQYYHYFAANRKQEVAGRRIGRLVDFSQTTEQMKSDYANRASDLVQWIDNKNTEFRDPSLPSTLDGIQQAINDLVSTYRNDEKPPKAAEKLALEALFSNINLKLKSNGREPFTAAAGTSPANIQQKWEDLGQAERDREDALRKEFERQKKLDALKRRFENAANKLEQWISAKDKYLKTEEQVDSLSKAKERIKFHEGFYDEYESSRSRVKELKAIADEISSLGASDADAIQERVSRIETNWTGLHGSAEEKKENLKKKLEIQERMEALRIDFAKQAKLYSRWAGDTIDDLNEHIFGNTLAEVQQYKTTLDSDSAAKQQESATKREVLQQLWNQIQEMGITDLKYTVLTMKDIENRDTQINDAVTRRGQAYDEELKRQLEMEERRKAWAAKAQSFVDHLATRRSKIQELQGEPAPLIESIHEAYGEGASEGALLNELNASSAEMREMGINDNAHTDLTIPILNNRNARFGNWVKNYIQSLKDEQELKDQYSERVAKLLAWIDATIPSLEARAFDNTLEGAQSQSSEFHQYKAGSKAEVAAQKPEIERIYKTISSLLKKNARPEFEPAAGTSLEDIDVRWTQLEEQEKLKEEALNAELERQEKLAILVRRFNSDAEDLSSWVNAKATYLAQLEEIGTLFRAQFSVKQLEGYEQEHRGRQPRLNQLSQLAEEIRSLNYKDQEALDVKFTALKASFDALSAAADAKKRHLTSALEIQQRNENLRIEFAHEAKEFMSWFKETAERINDYNFGFSLEAVAQYAEQLEQSDKEIKSQLDGRVEQLERVAKEMKDNSITDNSHTNITMETIHGSQEQLRNELVKRRNEYERELSKQHHFEEVRKEFATEANTFVEHLGQQRQALESYAGEPAGRVEHINSVHQEGAGATVHLEKVTTTNQVMKSEGIYGNTHTSHTLPSLVSRNNQHNNYVNSLIAADSEEREMQERIRNQEELLAKAEAREALVVEFSGKARALNIWMEQADEQISEDIGESVAEAEKASQQFDTLTSQQSQQHQELKSLENMAENMKSQGISDFSGITIEELNERWNQSEAALSARRKQIDDELARQKENDQHCRQFADKAVSLDNWLKSQTSQLNSQTGDLESQLKSIQGQRAGVSQGHKMVAELEAEDTTLQKRGIQRNPHTDLTSRALKTQVEEFDKALEKQESALNAEIITKKNADVTPEQLNEFKEVYNHFDKDGDSRLNKLELKACLAALGDDIADSELDRVYAELDPEGQGINFERFTAYMQKRNRDNDSAEEILGSFKSIANDKDFVTEEDLRRVMPNDKVEFLVKAMPKYQELGYDYQAWVKQQYQ